MRKNKKRLIFLAMTCLCSCIFFGCDSKEEAKRISDEFKEELMEEKKENSPQGQSDKNNLEEIVAQAKNCIADASVEGIEVSPGEIYLMEEDGEVVAYGETGIEQLMEKNYDSVYVSSFGVSVVGSRVDTEKNCTKVTIKEKADGSYKVTAQFIKKNDIEWE